MSIEGSRDLQGPMRRLETESHRIRCLISIYHTGAKMKDTIILGYQAKKERKRGFKND
jgi:hypothetical protein